MTLTRICDICRNGNETVKRYGLRRYIGGSTDSRRNANNKIIYKQRNAGGLDLCDNCWDRYAKPKTKAESAYNRRSRHPSLTGSKLQIDRQTALRLIERKDIQIT